MNYSHFSLWYVQYAIHDKCREISSPLLSWLNTRGIFKRALAERGFGGCHYSIKTSLYAVCLQSGLEMKTFASLSPSLLECVAENQGLQAPPVKTQMCQIFLRIFRLLPPEITCNTVGIGLQKAFKGCVAFICAGITKQIIPSNHSIFFFF